MGSGVNIWAFSVGLAAFAGWTLSRFTVPRRVGWANVLRGLGILALSLSIVSLDDDRFQQELIGPATSSVLSDSSINAFVETGDPIRVPVTCRLSVVMDQPLELDTHFHAPVPNPFI